MSNLKPNKRRVTRAFNKKIKPIVNDLQHDRETYSGAQRRAIKAVCEVIMEESAHLVAREVVRATMKEAKKAIKRPRDSV